MKKIFEVDVIGYDYPFDFIIGEDYYQVGIGYLNKKWDKGNDFFGYQFLMKNDKIIDFRDNDDMCWQDVVKIVNTINPNNLPICIVKQPHYLSCTEYIFSKCHFSSKLLKEIRQRFKNIKDNN